MMGYNKFMEDDKKSTYDDVEKMLLVFWPFHKWNGNKLYYDALKVLNINYNKYLKQEEQQKLMTSLKDFYEETYFNTKSTFNKLLVINSHIFSYYQWLYNMILTIGFIIVLSNVQLNIFDVSITTMIGFCTLVSYIELETMIKFVFEPTCKKFENLMNVFSITTTWWFGWLFLFSLILCFIYTISFIVN